MGGKISITECAACGEQHADVALLSPPVPPSFKVWGKLKLTKTPWYVCATFLVAVPVPIGILK